MRMLNKVTVVSFMFLLFGCNPNSKIFESNISGQPTPWTHLQFKNNLDNFQFAIVSDRNGGCRPGVFAGAVEKINLLQPEFVMCVGDLIAGDTEDEIELNKQWMEFDDIVNKLEMPFFYVPGNHDITNSVMLEKWKQRLGLPYYHFVYNNVLFLCLDSEDPPPQAYETGNLSDSQIEYFANVLNDNKDVSWTFLFMHKPLWEEDYKENISWENLEKLLQGRRYTVFAGHRHVYKEILRKEQSYYRLATTGGGSYLNGPLKGEFDHIVWVTMTEHEPQIATLALDGILESAGELGAFDISSFTDLKINDTEDELEFSLEIENPLAVDMRVQIEWEKNSASSWTINSAPEKLLIRPDGKRLFQFKAEFVEGGIFFPLPVCKVTFTASGRSGISKLGLPVDADEYLIKHRPNLVARQYQSKPAIDGRIDETIWQREPDASAFVDLYPENPASVKTEGWFAYDETNFYVAIRCYEPLMDMLKSSVDKRDGAVWKDDVIEVFLDTNRDRKSYYHFAVNTAAVVYDALGTENSHNTDIKAAAFKESNYWNVELAIPWADIKVSPPLSGTKMGFLLARTRHTEHVFQVLQYPPVNGGNHRKEFFGNLELQ